MAYAPETVKLTVEVVPDLGGIKMIFFAETIEAQIRIGWYVLQRKIYQAFGRETYALSIALGRAEWLAKSET